MLYLPVTFCFPLWALYLVDVCILPHEGFSISDSGFSCPSSLRHYLLFSKLLYLWSPKAFLPRASLVAQMVKCLPTMRETWVQSLGWKDLLEKEMATHSSILAWKIPWTEEPGRLQFMGLQSRTWLSDFTFTITYKQQEFLKQKAFKQNQ